MFSEFLLSLVWVAGDAALALSSGHHFPKWLPKMAAKILFLGHLTPSHPWSSPDLAISDSKWRKIIILGHLPPNPSWSSPELAISDSKWRKNVDTWPFGSKPSLVQSRTNIAQNSGISTTLAMLYSTVVDSYVFLCLQFEPVCRIEVRERRTRLFHFYRSTFCWIFSPYFLATGAFMLGSALSLGRRK